MAGFGKKNIEYTQRNGNSRESKTVIRYVTQTGRNGNDGADAFQVILSPNNHTFAANTDDQLDRVNVFVFRGTTPINSYIVESEIDGEIDKGSSNALTVTVHNNGTNQTYFDVSVNRFLNVDSSTLIIPIQYNVDVVDSSTVYDSSMWDTSIYNIATFNAIYSWNMASSGQSAYVLDLTNENASINADASGNIIRTAVRPTCQAKLTYGSQDVSSNVYYDMSWTMTGVTGIGINHQTGEVLWDSSAHSHDSKFPSGYFNFGDASTNTILEVTIDASFNNGMHREKVMSISKSLPGQSGIPGDPGEDAVSRWIELSADAIRVDSSNNCIPNKITATPWKQVGGNTPAIDQSTNIRWTHDSSVISTSDPSTAYTGAITVNKNWDYMTFKLYYQTTYLGESETVPILRDGKNGQPGAQGRSGPAVRGPWLWDSSTNTNKTGLSPRRFCDGTDRYSDSDANWIDIIIHNGTYYRCTTSYNSTVNDTWTGSSSSSVSGKWTEADASYEFVAAHLLLADNAKINFLSGNELYLMNSNNRITAGAAGGNGISFWAGAEQPSDAPFQVDYHGNIKATSGTFAGYVQMPYKFIGALQQDLENYYIADASAYLIADEYLTGVYYGNDAYSQGPILKLPEPSRALNGFTYHILVWPNIATRAADQNPALSIVTVYGNAKFLIPAFACDTALTVSPRKKIAFYAGHVEITCIPRREDDSTDPDDWTYYWMITMCTGGIEVFNNSDLRTVTDAYGPIYGYSPTDNFYVPVKIQTENNPAGSNRKRDTIYITLP